MLPLQVAKEMFPFQSRHRDALRAAGAAALLAAEGPTAEQLLMKGIDGLERQWLEMGLHVAKKTYLGSGETIRKSRKVMARFLSLRHRRQDMLTPKPSNLVNL
jgi:hypothetical protein